MVRIFKPTNQRWVKTAEVLNKQWSRECTYCMFSTWAGLGGWGMYASLQAWVSHRTMQSVTKVCSAWAADDWPLHGVACKSFATHMKARWSFTVTLAGWKINKIAAKLLLSDRREREWFQLCPHMLPQLVKFPFIVFLKPYICWFFNFFIP